MAVKDGRLASNVAKRVNLPRFDRHEHRYLTHDQVEDLATATGYPSDASRFSSLDTRANETYRLVVLFLAYTGVRFGEMAALRVARLDLRRNRAVIVESVTPVQARGWCGAPPRPTSDARCRSRASSPTSSPRTSPASSRRTWSSPASATASRCGSAPSGPRSAAAARAIGVPGLHPHQLRHTATSLAMASGADVKVVQQMLGHSSATMTLDTYGHLFEDRLDEVGDAMDRARTAARQRRSAPDAWPRVAPVWPQPEFGPDEEAAPTSVSAGQNRCSTLYPRPDSNRRYRLERAAC